MKEQTFIEQNLNAASSPKVGSNKEIQEEAIYYG